MFVEECKLLLQLDTYMVYTINKNVDANYLLYYPCGPKLEDDQSRIQLGLWSFKRLIYAIFVGFLVDLVAPKGYFEINWPF